MLRFTAPPAADAKKSPSRGRASSSDSSSSSTSSSDTEEGSTQVPTGSDPPAPVYEEYMSSPDSQAVGPEIGLAGSQQLLGLLEKVLAATSAPQQQEQPSPQEHQQAVAASPPKKQKVGGGGSERKPPPKTKKQLEEELSTIRDKLADITELLKP